MISDKMLEHNKVKSLSTKYIFNKHNLSYQIMITYGDGNEVLLKDFTNYDEYQNYHDHLVQELNNKHPIPNDFVQAS